jgi:co-chaperonin GroES (HSP10)
MGAPVRILHENDPADEIRHDLEWLIDGLEPVGADVLLVMYERVSKGEQKSTGGIIIPATQGGTATEDRYQGKAGLIVKKGPVAFEEDENHRWGSAIPKEGDWVLIDVRETYSFDVPIYDNPKVRVGSPTGLRRMRLVQDVHVRLIASPKVFDAIW